MRIVLFTGKGGVGKTTAAAATALRLADRGVKTLLLSTDPAHSLADALDVPLGPEPVEITPGGWAVQVDTQRRFEAAWGDVQRYALDVLSRGGVDPILAEELTVLPGVEDVLALLAVRDFAMAGQWDALVVDCAPTAETLRLLALPEALGWYLRRAFPLHRRLGRGLRPLTALLGGDGMPSDGLVESLMRLTEHLASVQTVLADPAVTTVRLVLTPESVVVAESRRTFTALALFGYRVDQVVANRVFAGRRDAFARGWSAAQRIQLDAARESFGGVPVVEVAYRQTEPVGAEALREVASALYGALPGTDPAGSDGAAPSLRVEPHGEGYLLRMVLPLVSRADVEATRVGDDLVVTVGSHRRVLALPSVLRRCDVVAGAMVDDELRITFRPDPALWRPSTGSAV